MDPIVSQCDACQGSCYILGELCWKCDGNGRIYIGDIPAAVKKASKGPRILAWVALIVLAFGIAYLIGHGGR